MNNADLTLERLTKVLESEVGSDSRALIPVLKDEIAALLSGYMNILPNTLTVNVYPTGGGSATLSITLSATKFARLSTV